MHTRRRITPYLLLFPAVILLILLYAYPFILTIIQSFQRVVLFGGDSYWVGFDNYISILTDQTFYQNLMTTFRYALLTIVLKMIVALILALFLHSDIFGKGLMRFIMLLPWAVPQVAVALVWKWIYDGQYGYLNYYLEKLGLLSERISWLADPDVTMYAVSFVDAWMGWPLITMMLLAGLEAIPESLYEASLIDGANAWRRFTNVTMPGIKNVFLITTTLVSIWTFNSFNVIYVLTQGGPLRTTETLMMRVYNESFQNFNFGVSSALTLIIIVLITFFTFGYIRQLFKED